MKLSRRMRRPEVVMQKELGGMALPRPLLEGTLKRLPLPDLLQSLTHGDPCQVLILTGENVRGFLWLAGKRVVRVRTPGKLEGKEAFLSLIRNGSVGGFRVFALPPDRVPAPEVENIGDLAALLVEAVIALDHENVAAKFTTAPVPDPCRTVPLGTLLNRLVEAGNA